MMKLSYLLKPKPGDIVEIIAPDGYVRYGVLRGYSSGQVSIFEKINVRTGSVVVATYLRT